MPHYVFLCQDCNQEFNRILHIADLEKGGVVCPHWRQAGNPKGNGVLRGYLQEELARSSTSNRRATGLGIL